MNMCTVIEVYILRSDCWSDIQYGWNSVRTAEEIYGSRSATVKEILEMSH